MHMTGGPGPKIAKVAYRAACRAGEAAELRRDDGEDTASATRSQREIAQDTGASDKKNTSQSRGPSRTARSHVTAGVRAHSRRRTAQGAGQAGKLRRVSIWQEGGSRECEEVWVHADSHTIGCR